MKVRVYTCRSFDVSLGEWVISKQRYTLEQIASFARSEPVLDDWIEVDRPDDFEIRRSMTGSIGKGRL